MAEIHHILFYDYVEDIAERRRPHREAHLAHVREWKDAGKVTLGGALGDPVHGAAIVFRLDDADEIDHFVATDPYIAAGLVRGHRVERWTVVT